MALRSKRIAEIGKKFIFSGFKFDEA